MESIEQLRARIKRLEENESFVVKEGEIVYINLPESPTEKFTKIDAGIDATVIYNGKPIKDFLAFQISHYDKINFAAFDQSEGNEQRKFKVGDRIKVMCEVGSYQSSVDKKNNNRTVIYNNVGLVKAMMIEAGAQLPSERGMMNNSEEAPALQNAEEETPF